MHRFTLKRVQHNLAVPVFPKRLSPMPRGLPSKRRDCAPAGIDRIKCQVSNVKYRMSNSAQRMSFDAIAHNSLCSARTTVRAQAAGLWSGRNSQRIMRYCLLILDIWHFYQLGFESRFWVALERGMGVGDGRGIGVSLVVAVAVGLAGTVGVTVGMAWARACARYRVAPRVSGTPSERAWLNSSNAACHLDWLRWVRPKAAYAW